MPDPALAVGTATTRQARATREATFEPARATPGGFTVYRPAGHRDPGRETHAAALLADVLQADAYLAVRTEAEGEKLLDVFVAGDGWEIERVTPEATSLSGALQRALRAGKEQAAYLDTPLDDGDELLRGVRNAFRNDAARRLARAVLLRDPPARGRRGWAAEATRTGYDHGAGLRLL